MYALITDGSITKYLRGNRGITIGDIQYPQNIFTVWTAAEKEAIGIYEVIQNNAKKKTKRTISIPIKLLLMMLTLEQ